MSKIEQVAPKKAIVKQVLSGDTIVVRAQPRGGPPPEKQINLSNVLAPRLGRKAGLDETRDEPYAWESREFLRKLLAGKEIYFALEDSPNTTRNYGKIYLDKDGKQSVTDMLVSEGLVTVRKENQKSPDVAHLTELEEAAKSNKKGIWSDDNKADHIRNATWTLTNSADFLMANKGKRFQAIVEHVRDGSTVRVVLLPNYTYITLMLAGIRCPSFKLDASGKPDEAVQVPYALEARFFTESRLLNQEVEVVLDSVSNANFVGMIYHPKGNIAEALVREGFAKCIDWSLNACGADLVEKLRIAEKTAKNSKLRLWETYQAPQMHVDVKEKEFTGTVLEVFNGDFLMVKCANNDVKKVFLSSTRSPKDAKPDEERKVIKTTRPLYDVPWLWECREFLRKKLINKKVTCKLDYISPAKDTMPERRNYTVLLNGVNISEQLVSKGLATVIRYRQDNDQRSAFYNELLAAEATAAKEQAGMHGKKETPAIRLVDLTVDTSKIRHQYLPSWQRALRMDAIVEFVASGSRFRIYIPRENVLVNFLLGGIICPRSSRPALNNQPAVDGEPLGDEALAFVRSKIFQRDISVQIESADSKFTAVIGWLFTENKTNLSVALLEEGLARIHPPSAEKSEYYRLLKAAEDKAKSKRLNMWKDYVEQEEQAAEEGVEAEAEIDSRDTASDKYEEIVVIEVLSDLTFYAQKTAEADRLNKLMENVKSALDSMSSGVTKPRRGEIVAAKFSADNQWYRAKIEKLSQNKAHILYIDYGNREVVDVSTLKELSSTLRAEKPYATEYKLALINVPRDEDDANEACSTFSSDVLDKKLKIAVQYRLQGVPNVIIKSADGKTDLGRELVADGFVLVEKRKEGRLQKLLSDYQEAEESARKAHLGIWRYGDITEDAANEFGLNNK